MSLFEQLCLACRTGDADAAEKLLMAGANVNGLDAWDSSPLYLASLCGHEQVVHVLLLNGAVSDTDKYEGVRCYHGALTDSIRRLLLSFDLSKAADATIPFASHFRALLEKSALATEDIALRIGGDDVKVHRFVLGARSEYFREKLLHGWSHKQLIELNQCDEEAFKIVLGYFYLNHDPYKFRRVDQKLLLKYAKKVRLGVLEQKLSTGNYIVDQRAYAKLMNELQLAVLDSAREDLKAFVERDVIGNSTTDLDTELLRNCSAFPDIILSVSNVQGKTFYPAHRAMLIRDDYFKVMFSSSFSEAQYDTIPGLKIVDRSQIHLVNLPVASPEVAEAVLRFLYYDHVDIPLDIALDVLFAGDVLLNDKLKSMAAVAIIQSSALPRGYDVYDILRAAWESRVDRLEHFVARRIAGDIDSFITDPEFHDIVLESARRIEVRQETDTIELVDDIRFYLAQKWKVDVNDDDPFKDDEETPGYVSYEMEMGKIEQLLNELGLDA